jgi:acetyltransferase-like isoleucine patch superfamily enzyme
MTVDLTALRGPVQLGPGVVLGEGGVLGCSKEARVQLALETGSGEPGKPVAIGAGCLIFNQVIIYEGVQLGHGCIIEDRVRIGYDSLIGSQSRLLYGAYLCDRVQVGPMCRVAGFVCDATWIGARCSVMGQLVHEYTRPHQGWWAVDEEPPRIEEDSVIAFGAHVVGGVTVGPRSYVAAGATITRDVPPEHIATGINELTSIDRWTGNRLQDWIKQWRKPD